MAYASRTGTRRNLAALRAAGWGLLVSARGDHRTEGFPVYALDNGAWTSFQRGEPFDVDAFKRALDVVGEGAAWVVAPDIVAGGLASLELSLAWLPRLAACRRVLIAVQDGIEPDDVAPHVSERVGIFLGGSTEWKLARAISWGLWCHSRGVYFHVARVNTAKRIRLCQEARAHSFDGSSASRFAVNVPRLTHATAQRHLWEAGS